MHQPGSVSTGHGCGALRRWDRSWYFRWMVLFGASGGISCAAPAPAGTGARGVDHTDSLRLIQQYEIDRFDASVAMRSVSQVEFLHEGRLLVSDGEARRMIVLAESGEMERSFGRPGGGPGDFRSLARFVRLRGDSVLGVDSRDGRFTVFDVNGVALRTYELHLQTPARVTPIPVAETGDAMLVFTAPHPSHIDGTTSMVRHSLGIYVGEAAPVAPLLLLVAPDRIQYVEGSAQWGYVLFTPMAHVAVRDNRVWVGVSDSSHITILDLGDGRSRQIPHGIPLRPVTLEMIGAERGRLREVPIRVPAFAQDARRALQDAIERLPSAKVLPAFDHITVDPHHRVWATRCDPVDGRMCTAFVIGQEGGLLLQIPLPPRFSLHEVASDRLVGVADYDDRGRVIEVRALPPELTATGNARSPMLGTRKESLAKTRGSTPP